MARVKLSLSGYRPLKPGEAGNSPTARRYINEKTGEIISRRQFAKQAQRTGESGTTGKTRKTRADKGYTREDWKQVRALKQDRKALAKEKRRTLTLTPEVGKQRFEAARATYVQKKNEERIQNNEEPYPDDYEPEDRDFYDLYDRIKHREDYSQSEYADAYDYFYGELEYDYPDGETP